MKVPVLLKQLQRGSELSRAKGDALVVLVGITAGTRKRKHLQRFFQARCDCDVFVPDLPYHKPLGEEAAWLADYLEQEVKPERREKLYGIFYIAAAHLLDCLPARESLLFDRAVFFRGPYQELVPDRLVRYFGRLLTGLIAGRSTIDLTDGGPWKLSHQRRARHEALIVEEGKSRLACLLGITSRDIPNEAWATAKLLPTAEDVLHVSQSHDDVYTTDSVLSAALGFIQRGSFPVD